MPAEEAIVRHCSPTLAGIKPANLVSLCGTQDYEGAIDALNRRLGPYGLRLAALRRSAEHTLVMAYSRPLLERRLAEFSVRDFLAARGYPVFGGISALMSELFSRFSDSEDFPHEVGIFLGYPLDDVAGFIRNGGRNFKASGIWKVYGSTRRAESLFKKYSDCARRCTEQYLSGIPIERICSLAR